MSEWFELEQFSRTLRTNSGQFAIIAARMLVLEIMARHILETEPGVLVHWGHKNIQYPSGAVAYLIPAKPNGEEHLRGLRLDGAWFLSGGTDELYLPESMKAYAITRSARPDFITWSTYL